MTEREGEKEGGGGRNGGRDHAQVPKTTEFPTQRAGTHFQDL